MEEKFKQNVRDLLKDINKFKYEPSIIRNIINNFEDENVEDLEL